MKYIFFEKLDLIKSDKLISIYYRYKHILNLNARMIKTHALGLIYQQVNRGRNMQTRPPRNLIRSTRKMIPLAMYQKNELEAV